MLKLSIDDDALQKNLHQLTDKDARQAVVWALNDTADDVLKHVQARMDEVFDRPTRFTKNAFMVWRAKPNNLEAEVLERPTVGSRHYLKAQELGGRRGQTGLEGLLSSRLSYDGTIQSAIPAAGAKLDAFGNWSNSERGRALTAVQSQRSAPAAVPAVQGKRKRKKAGFFVPKAGSGLSPGIWKRSPNGSISKILHFSATAPAYTRRLGFQDGAEEVYRARLPIHLARTFERMVARVAARG